MTSPARIIFLDLDGVVLNHSGGCDQDAMQHLNQLCVSTGAEVVLISARLRIQPEKTLEKFLREEGFTGTFHSDVMHRSGPFSRGKDIDHWVAEHHMTPQDYVILDDQTKGYARHHQLRLIHPTDRLREADLHEALNLFSPPRPARSLHWQRLVSQPRPGLDLPNH